jgi:hypothetical protein
LTLSWSEDHHRFAQVVPRRLAPNPRGRAPNPRVDHALTGARRIAAGHGLLIVSRSCTHRSAAHRRRSGPRNRSIMDSAESEGGLAYERRGRALPMIVRRIRPETGLIGLTILVCERAARARVVVPLMIAVLVHRFRVHPQSVHQNRDLGRRPNALSGQALRTGGWWRCRLCELAAGGGAGSVSWRLGGGFNPSQTHQVTGEPRRLVNGAQFARLDPRRARSADDREADPARNRPDRPHDLGAASGRRGPASSYRS